eukprot:TRINITY_DN8536_c0_g1_i3.p1 TRINITY_DN8536_c0_g1~~TRINITY_DN8536_c0_g1_i3.p1  ORF type:complete len:408 (-),score=107.34 TRINITY_DN8536_c0_g1_i3:577-1800(-)
MENENGPEKSEQGKEDKDGVTMLDVLQDEQELEEDANAVLGAADDQNCTYDEGYLARQPLYACLTCTQPENPDFKPAGICLACSYKCHERCELVELYTKRSFRCDCPTKKFSSDHKCKLKPGKVEENAKNSYSQNFSGVYCSCSRPYPDPEDPIEDEMIQCVICEDWYHGRHLGLGDTGPPQDTDYGEMICRGCARKYPLLINYKGVKIPESTNPSTTSSDPQSASTQTNHPCKLKPQETVEDDKAVDGKVDDDKKKDDSSAVDGEKSKDGEEPEESKAEAVSETLFLPEGWRSCICRCEKCVKYFKSNKIEFLLDEKDTVHHYESQGKKRAGQFEQGMEALSQMDRVQQVEAISMYNNMKTDLMGYLASFAREGKVVKEEDIRKFFSDMKSAKRPRLDLPPPDSCK